jgi:hypothetical protein
VVLLSWSFPVLLPDFPLQLISMAADRVRMIEIFFMIDSVCSDLWQQKYTFF